MSEASRTVYKGCNQLSLSSHNYCVYDDNTDETGAAVDQLVERSPLVREILGSIPAHAMWALCWTNTVCVGFLGVLQFSPTFFIPPIHPIIVHSA